MSKTVKRVMRVMMIGLVALLGANAEAHYFIVAGKVKYCDICLALDLREVEDPSTTGFGASVTGISWDLLCEDNNGVFHTEVAEDTTIQVDADQATLQIMKNRKAQVTFHFPVDDDLNPPDPDLPLPPPACLVGTGVDSIIRTILSVDATVFVNGAAHSNYRATTCVLPGAYNFDRPPTDGVRYPCAMETTMHPPSP